MLQHFQKYLKRDIKQQIINPNNLLYKGTSGVGWGVLIYLWYVVHRLALYVGGWSPSFLISNADKPPAITCLLLNLRTDNFIIQMSIYVIVFIIEMSDSCAHYSYTISVLKNFSLPRYYMTIFFHFMGTKVQKS